MQPSFSGDEFNVTDALQIIREKRQHMRAQCAFNPVWTEVFTNHYCGRWENKFHHEESLSEFIWGSGYKLYYEEATEKIKKLRKQLEHSRQVSASRLARLRAQMNSLGDSSWWNLFSHRPQ
jgi:acyl carrier protein phosphodiesterase